MSLTIGNISFYNGPQQLGGEDDLKEVIVNFINAAQKHLYIAVQEIDNAEIAQAIIDARKRKVTVKIVIENDYLRSEKPHNDPWNPEGKYEINRVIYSAILRTAIHIRSDYNSSIFHQKFIIRDGEFVLTGSTNFTTTGVTKNLNHIVVIHDKNIAKIYGKEYREIQQGHFGKLREGQDPKPPLVRVSDVPLKVLFAPDHGPEMEIMKQMAKAKERIDFAIFTFSNSSGIDDQIKLLEKSNITIRGVFDGRMVNQKWAASHELLETNAELYKVQGSSKLGKLHHKLMVIDKQVVIIGSFNYTGPANKLNDENIIIFGDLEETNQTAINVQKQIGEFAFKEIERIITVFGTKL